jgi:hypothetical protein
MRSMRHPITSVLYELDGDGNVRLTDGDRSGTFDRFGRWLSGDKLIADPELCIWVGAGPRQPEDLSTNRRFRNVVVPVKAGTP